ncbi:hypothetical protein ANCCAN_23750 [Ancylostoma caninum]|uniref:Uncharacterized protein n=1 Tax=Ancylostoma caninum TaxID=29170 RepID=A0A368FI27_ANCCA|nr:hypothetical protein ANCCAN_23750 [Ancylostoma caninum]
MVCILAGVEIAEAAKERHGNDVDLEQLYEGFDTNVKDILRALAYNQASSLQFSSEERRKLAGNPVETVYPTMVKSDDFSKMIQELYNASEDLKPAGEKLAKMVDEMFVLELTSTMNGELGGYSDQLKL